MSLNGTFMIYSLLAVFLFSAVISYKEKGDILGSEFFENYSKIVGFFSMFFLAFGLIYLHPYISLTLFWSVVILFLFVWWSGRKKENRKIDRRLSPDD